MRSFKQRSQERHHVALKTSDLCGDLDTMALAPSSVETQHNLQAVACYTASTVELLNSLTLHCDSQLDSVHSKLQQIDKNLQQLEQQLPAEKPHYAEADTAQPPSATQRRFQENLGKPCYGPRDCLACMSNPGQAMLLYLLVA